MHTRSITLPGGAAVMPIAALAAAAGRTGLDVSSRNVPRRTRRGVGGRRLVKSTQEEA